MDTIREKYSKLSLLIPDDRYEVLEEKAIDVNITVSDLLTLFIGDLTNDNPGHRPVSTLAHGWYQDCVQPSDDDPSFVQWLTASYRMRLFSCLLDSLFFHVDQIITGKDCGRDLSRDEFCIQTVHDLMLEDFCETHKAGSMPPDFMLNEFPLDVQIHMKHIFATLMDLYKDYLEYMDFDEEDNMFAVDVFQAFDLWKERKLRY